MSYVMGNYAGARTLKVLHVTPYYEPAYVYGGPARSVPLLCRALARSGVEVTVLTTDANGTERLDVPLDTPLDRDGVQVYYFARCWPLSIFFSPDLGRKCLELIPTIDLVHITSLWTYPCALAARTAHTHQKPYVISLRGTLMPWCFRHRWWKKIPYFYLSEYWRLRKSAGLHCTSYAEKQALNRFGLDSLGFVVPNGLNLSKFSRLSEQDRGSLRSRLGISPEAKLILFVGRLHRVKGIELTMKAFRYLVKKDEDLHLVLVGPDEEDYAGEVRQWAVRHRLLERVHLTGKLEGSQLQYAYADADLFVLLSRSENFGMSAVEAMAYGLPVVVSPETGISHWVDQWSAGIVVEREVELAARAMRQILDCPETLQRMRENGCRLVRSNFSADAVGHQMLTVYDQIVNHRRGIREFA